MRVPAPIEVVANPEPGAIVAPVQIEIPVVVGVGGTALTTTVKVCVLVLMQPPLFLTLIVPV